MSQKSMLMIHHGDPIAYPPLMHALQQLSHSGYQITLLGCQPDPGRPLAFPPNLQVARHLTAAAPIGASWLDRLGRIWHWLWLIFNATWLAITLRPQWIYLSNPASLVIALPARLFTRARILYQEHDSIEPQVKNESSARRWQRWLRLRILKRAHIVVFPNAGRLAVARAQAGRGSGADLVIWNVAPLAEALSAPTKPPNDGTLLRLHFHGSMSKFAVPLALIDALAELPKVTFQFASYEIGGRQHTEQVLARARHLGISERVVDLGTLSSRPALLAATQKADVGLAFYSESPKNVNHFNMAGATNKIFDYLGAGLALLCSNGVQWKDDFIPNFGVSTDPENPDAIAASLRQLLDQKRTPSQLGRLGQEQIINFWHFEALFQPVLSALASADSQD